MISVAQPLRQIPLTLRPDAGDSLIDLSAVRCVDQFLWLGSDEGTTLERLTLMEAQGTEHCTFPLTDYLDLPHGEAEEVDIEGLAYADYYLWVVGSHSVKRQKPQPDGTTADNLDRLSRLKIEKNRYLLARIPLVKGQLFRECLHPQDPGRRLTAAQLKPKPSGNHLTHVLRKDPHLGPFLRAQLPGKDNGFDVEGLAVTGTGDHLRILVGLRGPVLRGWAIILELAVKTTKSGQLKLVKHRETGDRYRKYFLDLAGYGIRDLCWDGDDLLILAGPTMDLDGLCYVYRLPQAAADLEESFLYPQKELEILNQHDSEKAEGMTRLPADSEALLVVYDAPDALRLQPESATVMADIFDLPSQAS